MPLKAKLKQPEKPTELIDDPTPEQSSAALEKLQHDSANYIAEAVLALRGIAQAAKLFKVMVPLEFAYYEASTAENHTVASPEHLEWLKRVSKAQEN